MERRVREQVEALRYPLSSLSPTLILFLSNMLSTVKKFSHLYMCGPWRTHSLRWIITCSQLSTTSFQRSWASPVSGIPQQLLHISLCLGHE